MTSNAFFPVLNLRLMLGVILSLQFCWPQQLALAGSTGSCQFVLSSKTSDFLPPERTLSADAKKQLGDNQISLNEFLRLKDDYRTWLLQHEELAKDFAALVEHGPLIQTAAEKLAFFEAYAENTGRDYLSWLRLANADEKKSALYLRMVAALKMENQVSGYQMINFIEDAYEIANAPPRTSWQRYFGKSYKQIIAQRVELELAQSNLMAAMRNLGLARDNSALELVKNFQRQVSQYEQLTVAGGVQYVAYRILGLTPIWFPLTSLARAQNAEGQSPDQIRARANSVPGKIKAGLDFATDKAYRAFFAFFLISATSFILHHLADPMTVVHQTVAAVQVLEGFAEMALHGNFQLDFKWDPVLLASVHSPTYQVWAQMNFFQAHGRLPDPFTNTMDRQMWYNIFVQLSGLPPQ